jgi:PKD repeat protein
MNSFLSSTSRLAFSGAVLSLLAVAGCRPEKNDGELGALPDANFDIIQTAGSNSVKFVNRTTMPSIAYWNISTGQTATGDTVNTSFTFAGTYNVTLRTVARGGLDSVTKTVTIAQNDPTACQSPTNVQAFLAGCTQKKWRLMPSAYAEMVGPGPGDGSWWGNPAADVTASRACEWNDEYIFKFDAAQGTYQFDNKGDFFDDGYMGLSNFTCEPNANLTGLQALWGLNTTTFKYAVSPAGGGNRAKLTLIGKGAHVAMAKVQNGGEFTGGPVNNSITYEILSMTHEAGFDKLVLTIQAGNGVWWTFTLRTF